MTLEAAGKTEFRASLAVLERRSEGAIRDAVFALIHDDANRAEIRSELHRLIDHCTQISNSQTPLGLRTGQQDLYRDIVQAGVIQHAAIQTLLGICGPQPFLDDAAILSAVDSTGVLKRLADWPVHLETMRARAEAALANFQSRHEKFQPSRVQIYGVGGSGAPHDISTEILHNFRLTGIPIDVLHTDEPHVELLDANSLVLFSSFSGSTEETLNCYRTIHALSVTEKLVGIGQPGELLQQMRADGFCTIELPHQISEPGFVMQPRESVCLQVTASLTFLAGLNLPPGPDGAMHIEQLDFHGAAAQLAALQRSLAPESLFATNPAKQLALFLLYGVDLSPQPNTAREVDSGSVSLMLNHPQGTVRTSIEDLWTKRIPFVISDRNNAALAHEVRTQFHERSKLNAVAYDAPECLHNLVESIRTTSESAIAGLDADPWTYYFLRSVDEESRVGQRLNETIRLVMTNRSTFAEATIQGANPFHRALATTYFNAHVSTYLAILNGYDPLPVPTMSWLKNVMRDIPRTL